MVVLLDGGRERVRRSASQYATPSTAASDRPAAADADALFVAATVNVDTAERRR